MDSNTLRGESTTAATTRPGATRSAHTRRRLAGVLTAAALGLGALGAQVASATTTAAVPDASANYSYQTLDNSMDTTFNQLLGINNDGLIAGYYGSGLAGHPNRGYVLHPGGQYGPENVPGAAQTQVIAINDNHITVGFWADAAGDNHGFYAIHQHGFRTVDFPTRSHPKTKVDQLLGVNDQGVAVGFYTDGSNTNHAYTYNVSNGRYGRVNVPGLTNLTGAAINNLGDIAGFGTDGSGDTVAYLLRSDGRHFTLSVPGASATQAFGLNDGDEVVGQYTVGTGNSAQTFGFVWVPGVGFSTVSDPNGVGSTTINGVNDRGDLVGFYTDSQGNVDGMLATPAM